MSWEIDGEFVAIVFCFSQQIFYVNSVITHFSIALLKCIKRYIMFKFNFYISRITTTATGHPLYDAGGSVGGTFSVTVMSWQWL